MEMYEDAQNVLLDKRKKSSVYGNGKILQGGYCRCIFRRSGQQPASEACMRVCHKAGK